jgi:phage shock protein A
LTYASGTLAAGALLAAREELAKEIFESAACLKVTACDIASDEGVLDKALDGLFTARDELAEEISEETTRLKVTTEINEIR